MPGDGFAADGEEQLWAYRCKLYIYRRKSKSWVDIGTGKGSLRRSHPSSGVEFAFVDEKNKIPMARHFVETATALKPNSGTDKCWSWTAKDQIQEGEGTEDQWFSLKFSTVDAAKKFKAVYDTFRPPGENEGADEDESKADTLLGALPVSPLFGAAEVASPASSCPASPEPTSRTLRHLSSGGREAFLLYFEKGVHQRGAAVRQASTIYIGAYDSKVQALSNAVRAMDHNCDPIRPWRDQQLWSVREDHRDSVGDKGVIILVQDDDGVYFQTKLRKVPLNMDLSQKGGSETALWT